MLQQYHQLDLSLYMRVVCVRLAHLSFGFWKDIPIAHVIIIITSEVSTLPIVIIFFRGCVPEIFVTSHSVTYYIYIPGNRDFVFSIIAQFMTSANSRIRLGLQILFVCLYITPSHYYHCMIRSEVWTVIEYLGLGHETMLCAVCFSIFLCMQS